MGVLQALITNSNTLLLIPLLFPMLILVYIVTSSVMNNNIIGIIYLMGYLITLVNNYIISSLSVDENNLNLKSEFCYKGIPIVPYNNSLSSPNMAIIIYSLCYFLIPQFLRNINFIRNPIGFAYFIIKNNAHMFAFFTILVVSNYYSELTFNCSEKNDIFKKMVVGGFIGFFSAWLYVLLFYLTGNKYMLLKNHFLSNKTICELPTNRMFRCDNENSDNMIVFAMDDKELDATIDDIVNYGDDELENLKSLKTFNIYDKNDPDIKYFKYLHVYGKTSLFFYDRENYKGNRKMLLYKDITTKEYSGNENPEDDIIKLYPDENKYVLDYDKLEKKFNKDIGIPDGRNKIISIQMKKES